MKLAEAADMIDMGVRTDDSFHRQTVAAEQFEDARNFVSRVDDQRFPGHRIADNRAIALQHSHWNGDVDQTVRDGIERWNCVAHIFQV